jgi:hypothetical protein
VGEDIGIQTCGKKDSTQANIEKPILGNMYFRGFEHHLYAVCPGYSASMRILLIPAFLALENVRKNWLDPSVSLDFGGSSAQRAS